MPGQRRSPAQQLPDRRSDMAAKPAHRADRSGIPGHSELDSKSNIYPILGIALEYIFYYYWFMGVVVSTSTLTDRLNAVRDLFGEVIAELEHAVGLMPPVEILDAADGVEAISRQAGYAQLLAAKSIEDQVFADLQQHKRSEFRNCAEFLQSRLRIRRSEARRRLNLGAAVLPRRTLVGEPLDAKYRLLNSLAAHAVTDLPALQLAVTALDEAALKTMSNAEQATHRQTAMTARGRTLELMESSLAEALTDQDPDFLTPLIRRWDTLIDQDGMIPDEAELRHRQGLYRRETRRGLTRFELWADQIQTETLLTVMHAGSNPRAGAAKSRPLDARSLQQFHLDTVISALRHAFRDRALPQAGGQAAQLIATIDYQSLVAQSPVAQSPVAQSPVAQSPVAQPKDNQPAAEAPSVQSKARLQFTGPVPPRLIRRLACDAGLVPAVLAGDGEVLDLGRKRRLFSPAQRAALIARDKGCAFPGCTIPASWCEAHHLEPWQHGGTTSVANGALLCSHHHHVIHLGEWRIERGVPGPRAEAEPGSESHQGGPGQSGSAENRSQQRNRVTDHDVRSNPEPASLWFIPPRWIDPQQTPRQNHFHQL